MYKIIVDPNERCKFLEEQLKEANERCRSLEIRLAEYESLNQENILVVRSKIHLKPDRYKEVYDVLYAQKEAGVILLPAYLEAILVPNDTEIEFERLEEKKDDQT